MNIQKILISSILLILFLIFSNSTNAQSLDCSDCHENVIENSVHDGAVECADCHSDVVDEEHMEKGAKKVNCADCHDEYASLVSTDIHHRLKDRVKNPPNCVTCHGDHKIKSPSTSKNKVKDYCSKCHDNIVLANPYHAVALKNETCFDCHESVHLTELSESVHPQLACADCHNYISHNIDTHLDKMDKSQRADCYMCHKQIASEHRESIHGISLLEGIDEAAQCWDCHGSHNIKHVKDELSTISSRNLPATCGKCHNDQKIVDKYDITMGHPSVEYSKSVHGKNVAAGGNAATCISCHGVHNIKSRTQDGSTISVYNVPNTCGQCHADISSAYMQSIHWIRAKKGVRMSPVCTDCHSEHDVNAVSFTDNSRHEYKLLQEKTCLECHTSKLLNTSYGLDQSQAKQYQDSYHGLAVMRGDEDAAMCIDCHGVHKILPKKYDESTVSEVNIVSTCQQCHPEAGETFSKSYTHKSGSEEATQIESVVEKVYIILIIVVIGGMILHNLIIFISELKAKRNKEKHVIRVPRFTKNEIIQHVVLFVTFITLSITGFALKYPDSWWGTALIELGLIEPVRQVIHKTSGALMLVLSFYHLFYLLSTGRGREVLVKMFPTLTDVKQVAGALAYYLGLSKNKPAFDKYDYAEKAEYWALIWGTLVMGVTGLILWFPTIVGDWAPIWFIKVSELIHFYEAILATLAIVVWHWFFVILRPSEYPMSFAWVDGKMTLNHYKSHHKAHLKQVLLEIMQYKFKERTEKQLSNYTKLFMQTMKEQNIDAYDLARDQMKEDDEIKDWIESRLNNNKVD